MKFEIRSQSEANPNPAIRDGLRGITVVRSSSFTALLFLLFTFASFAAELDSPFHRGSQAYAAGGFEQAAAFFEDVLKISPSSGALHNLGNAEWQRGRAGYAILAWERAQWLDPYSANTRANLRFGRKTAQLDAPDLAWHEICSKWLPVDAWAWIAGVSLWLAISMVVLPGILRWRKADWHQGLAAAGFAVFLLCIPAMMGVQSRSRLGVVVLRDTPLRLTPTREAQVLTKLPAGDVVRLERERGGYVYVRAGNDAAGWVERTQFGRISSL